MKNNVLDCFENLLLMLEIIQDLNDLNKLSTEEKEGYLDFFIDNYIGNFKEGVTEKKGEEKYGIH